ncbi:MAG: glycoside hydrolase family 3 C-terminal domain-containing protein [Candidatus Azobacteroides sp.]|nr:glycoside hydrolase family 3 C-terminal domain-containing protein [Candidatus Azobacteroides sp.]
MKSIYRIVLLAVFTFSFTGGYPQQDPETEKKIETLVSQMTLAEKVGQMNQLNGGRPAGYVAEAVRNGQVGSILNGTDVKTINELQRIAVEESRLKIPLVFARDVIHGYKTIFPIPLGQAASWNPAIAEKGAQVAAQEASSAGIRWTFAPMIDVTREPRWGRIAESCGEDTYLTSVMEVAMIKGFQGDNLSAPTSIAACAKHFAGYGAAEAGKDYNTTWIPEQLLREVYLPPFKAATDAGAATFMCAFNDLNGVPASANEFLIRDILRDEWKYDGMMVSDWGSVKEMVMHGFCADEKEAAERAAKAGVDMDMDDQVYFHHLEQLVKEGTVDEKLLDEAVRNILRLKFRLGLFENPYADEKTANDFYRESSLEAAKQAAIEGTILLDNKNSVLPLQNTITSVAVVGPLSHAPADQIGTWCFDGEPAHSVTPAMAIQKEYGSKIKVLTEAGLTYSRDKNKEGIEKAVAVGKQADVILFFAGEEAILSGEARCRADIGFPGAQTEMLEALKQTGKPVVMIVMCGRPMTIGKEIEMADATLLAFHGGTMAGPALADILIGKAVPSGKLPVTMPRMAGQIPIYYNHKSTGRPASDITLIDDIEIGAEQTSIGFTSYHLDAGDSPLYPFGYGLSYTTFEYSSIRLDKNELTKDSPIMASVTVKNTGNYKAAEVVQLYIRDLVSGSVTRPVKELKGFRKITLEPGESEEVSFEITEEMLRFWNTRNEWISEPGDFHLFIGSSSADVKQAHFVLK